MFVRLSYIHNAAVLVALCGMLMLILYVESRIRLCWRTRLAAGSDATAAAQLRKSENAQLLERITRGLFVIGTFVYEVLSVKGFQGIYCAWIQERLLMYWDLTQVHLLCSLAHC